MLGKAFPKQAHSRVTRKSLSWNLKAVHGTFEPEEMQKKNVMILEKRQQVASVDSAGNWQKMKAVIRHHRKSKAAAEPLKFSSRFFVKII